MTTISISVTLIIITNQTSEGICSCNVYDMTLGINMCALTGTMCASAVFFQFNNDTDTHIIKVKNYADVASYKFLENGMSWLATK